MKNLIKITLLSFTLSLLTTPSFAHYFAIKPFQFSVDSFEKIAFVVISSETLLVPEELESLENTNLQLIQGSNTEKLQLKNNDVLQTLDGIAKVDKNSSAIIAGHRKGMIWTNTKDGWKQAGKKGLTGVIKSSKYEKFCKVLVNSKKNDSNYKKVVGHKFEIVPMTNPALLDVGDYMEIKISLDGKPVSTGIKATYEGFSEISGAYAYYVTSSDKGIAKIKITSPGTWIINAKNEIKKGTEDYDTHVLKTMLIFAVK